MIDDGFLAVENVNKLNLVVFRMHTGKVPFRGILSKSAAKIRILSREERLASVFLEEQGVQYLCQKLHEISSTSNIERRKQSIPVEANTPIQMQQTT